MNTKRPAKVVPVVNVKQQRGIGLPAAIFVITLLVSISVAINLLLSQNANTFQEEIQLTRAFYAAEAGAGFTMNAVFPPEEFPSYSVTAPAACPVTGKTYTFTADGLSGCTATVTCTVDATVDDVEFFTIQSVGACGDVQRTVQVRSSF
ncbi:hypothetical protein E3V39_06955 [Gammaproteobacteria bacterium LSUCC0112]|nr:hypothetical protein E3V39_06955 [Gammaproteobacteria bacterium LSUCC0112]